MTASYTDFAKYVERVRRYPKRARALTVGDSWFQYPLRRYGDLQRKIATRFATKLVCFDDSYPGRDADEAIAFLPRWGRYAAHLDQELGKPFDLILVSLGGNDVIGKDFAKHLKKRIDPPQGTAWPWHAAVPAVARDHVKLEPLLETFERVREAYEGLVALRDRHATRATILAHTYADVTPGDAPYRFVGFESGPWLYGPMQRAGLHDADGQRELARWLLASFFALLDTVRRGTRRFVVLDTRLELSRYDGWWDNEIHPRGKGFEHLVERFWAPAIRAVV